MTIPYEVADDMRNEVKRLQARLAEAERLIREAEDAAANSSITRAYLPDNWRLRANNWLRAADSADAEHPASCECNDCYCRKFRTALCKHGKRPSGCPVCMANARAEIELYGKRLEQPTSDPPRCNPGVVCTHEGSCNANCGGDHYWHDGGYCLRCGEERESMRVEPPEPSKECERYPQCGCTELCVNAMQEEIAAQRPSNPLHTELAGRFFKECSDRSLKFDPDERAIVVMFAAWLDGRAADVATACPMCNGTLREKDSDEPCRECGWKYSSRHF